MNSKITKEDVFDFLKAGGMILGELAQNAYRTNITPAAEAAFSEAIEIGIENTIAALYDANVEDKEILRVVSEQWGLTYTDTEDRLTYEKSQATIRALTQYLKLRGFSSAGIDQFMIVNRVALTLPTAKAVGFTVR